jgi:hypothetical protein
MRVEETFTSIPTTMSTALKIPEVAPAPQPARPPYRLSANELRLRNQFVAAFNDVRQPGWELHIAAWDVTDELKSAGELPEGVVKRIKYIGAIPIAFHYRAGYKHGHARLADTVRQVVSLSIARYFADEGG